jgi:hypothetical protein
MTLILVHGRNNEAGYVLLRSLIIMVSVVLCFAFMLGGIAAYVRYGNRLLEIARRELQTRNDAVHLRIVR